MSKSRRERQRLLKLAESGAEKTVSGEIGVSGTTNYSGRIYAESNSKLRWEKAFGIAGTFEWGAWERLERTDQAVSSALNLVSAPLRDSEIEVEGPDENIASFVRDNFVKWLEPQAPAFIEQVVHYGLAYGFGLHEIVTGVRADPRVPGGLAVYIKKMAQRLPSSIATDGWIEKDGELSVIRQEGWREGRWVTVELPASKVLLATWNRSGNNYQGFSAFRPVWYLGEIRAELLRILAIGHQREALGIPVATVDKDAPLQDPQMDALQRLLENLVPHENAAAVLPKGVSLNWVFSPGANKGHVLQTWRELGIAILETVQAQQIALGTGETGSRSVGEVHDASKNAFVSGIRSWLEAAINGIGEQPYTGLVKKLVDWNFGPQDEYPKLKLVTRTAELDAVSLSTAVSTLSTAGAIKLDLQDENTIRARLGLRQVEPEERPESKQATAQLFQYHILAGIATLNEIRASVGLPRVEGGDVIFKPESPAGAPPGAAEDETGMSLSEILGEGRK